MLALAFVALAGGVVLMVAGVTGSSVASAAQGHPDHSRASQITGGTEAAASASASPGPAANKGSAGQTVYDRLTSGSLRLTPAQAAGVLGNLQQESGTDPTATGGYMAQWLGARLEGLLAFARRQGSPVTSAALQAEYIEHELTGSERGALLALKRTSTPEQAARVFSELYERPGVPMLANRERYAREALQTYGAGK